MIPLAMRLKIRQSVDDGGRRVNLWVPLFLVWILALPIIIFIAAVWLVLRIVSPFSGTILAAVRIIEAGTAVLWKLNGLRIDVRDRESRFILHF